jgi:hypothetical protein
VRDHVHVNRGPLCRLCREDLRRLGEPAGAATRARVPVRGVMVCPTHDLAGPVAAYPVAVVEAVSPRA